jgi:hypothetical protein
MKWSEGGISFFGYQSQAWHRREERKKNDQLGGGGSDRLVRNDSDGVNTGQEDSMEEDDSKGSPGLEESTKMRDMENVDINGISVVSR